MKVNIKGKTYEYENKTTLEEISKDFPGEYYSATVNNRLRELTYQLEMEGIPIRVELGSRDLEQNQITIARRDTNEKITISLNSDITLEIQKIMEQIQRDMLKKATERRDKMTYVAKNMKDIEEIITKHPGFIKAMWCGDQKCEEEIKKINGTKSRCIPFNEENLGDTCVCCGKKAKKMVIWGLQY